MQSERFITGAVEKIDTQGHRTGVYTGANSTTLEDPWIHTCPDSHGDQDGDAGRFLSNDPCIPPRAQAAIMHQGYRMSV